MRGGGGRFQTGSILSLQLDGNSELELIHALTASWRVVESISTMHSEHFVVQVASAFIVTCIIAVTSSTSPTSSPHRYDVLIIGAGVAGVSAGQRLLQNNITNILVLEARDRIGGRIHTTTFGGESIDLGAQYVYAFDGNTVYDMTKDLGEFYQAPERKSDLLSWGGYKLNKPYLNDMMKLPLVMAQQDNSSFSQRWLPKLSNYMVKKNISYEDGTLYLDAGRKLFSIHNGADVDKVSAWGISQFRESSYGRSKMWQSGFINFFKVLMGEIGDKSPYLGLPEKIQLEKEVVRVQWNDAGATVTCRDGSTYEADKVLVTLPLGVLKHLPHDFFLPPLTQERKKVIKNLGFGFVDKLFLEFDRGLTQDRNILFALHSDMKSRFAHTVFKGMWPTGLTGICPTRDSPMLLNSWLVGWDAATMERQPDETVVDGVLAMTRTILGKQIPRPLALLRSKWATDRFARGSYSYRSVETEAQGVSHGQLSEPIVNSLGQPVVLFAGEATSELHYGTVHGALESGWDTAQIIINSIT